ncbi:signal peptidase I [Gordonia sp. VNK1]|jgi:signal peptidase|uniref:signal peptidase I n=1 Tax=Gordonia oleivorans TaxID=3156618 RepID=UPI0032B4DCAB
MTDVMPAQSAGRHAAGVPASTWKIGWIPDDPAETSTVETIAAPTTRTNSPEPAATPIPPRRSLRSRIVDWLLNVLAVFGLICIVLVIWAYVGNYTLIMFKTGSMSPTIPQGSLSLVHKIPASEVRAGDIVTIDREAGKAPVTHRVVSVTPTANSNVVEIVMKGDANPNPDPHPYQVTEVRKVVWHMPGLAKQVVWLSNPYVLGTLTIVMSGLVLWAFWPRTKVVVVTQPRE